jgi:FkbM family methyltransferase
MPIKNVIKRFFKYFKIKISRDIDFERLVLQHLLNKVTTPLIFDVGAYIGEKAQYYRSNVANSKIICFEPFPESFRKLQQNLSDKPFVKLENLAVSDFVGKTSFSVKTNFDEGNSLFKSSNDEFGKIAEDILKESEEIEVDVTSLDVYASRNNITKIDLLKLDIQGAELLALKGSIGLLRSKKIDYI